jgi:hypothetical protein
MFLTGAGLALLAVVAVVAQADIIQGFKASVTPAKAGKGVGYKIEENTSIANEPGYKAPGQPPPQTTQTIRLAKGFQFNGKYFPRCKLANLQAKGPKGCPSGSKVGTGQGIGSARPVVTDPVNGKLTLFNGEKKGGKDTFYVFTLPDLGPTFVVVGTISKINKGPYGYELSFTIPPIKTINRAPDAAIISVKTNVPARSVKVKKGRKKVKKYMIVAPAKCKGKWAYQGVFKFQDGRTSTVSGSQKCSK